MKVSAVIFDRDNTLVFFEAAAVARLEEQLTTIAPGLPPGAAAAAWLRWPGPWPRRPADEPAFWQQFWASLAERHQLSDDETARLCEVGASYHTCFAAYPDVTRCLRTLRAAGLRLAVLTNFELPDIERTLTHAGIDPRLFSALLSSGSIGAAKPDSRAFRAAVDTLGVPPEQCAFVDDDPTHVAAARGLGMRAFLIDRTRATHDLANATLCSLDPLPEVILPPFTIA